MKELLLLSFYLVFGIGAGEVYGFWYGLAAIFFGAPIVFGIMCAMAPEGETDW